MPGDIDMRINSIPKKYGKNLPKRWQDMKLWPWSLKQLSGVCGFTAVIWANLFTSGPSSLLPLIEAIFFENKGNVADRVWKRIQLINKFHSLDDYRLLDIYLTVGFMLIFKDRYGKKAKMGAGSELYDDCIKYSNLFTKLGSQFKPSPLSSGTKLGDVMATGSSGDKALLNSVLSVKAGDLALSVEGLQVCIHDFLPPACTAMYTFEPGGQVRPLSKGEAVCELWGLGRPANKKVPEMKPYFYVTHWVFVPEPSPVNDPALKSKVWTWGREPESNHLTIGSINYELFLRVRLHYTPDTGWLRQIAKPRKQAPALLKQGEGATF